jgi:putative multiple sugar transport system permease protein
MNGNVIGVLKKNTMLIALVLVLIIFEVMVRLNGNGTLFSPQNIFNLISQNGYVVILACGMLLCILAGGNIDLSVGSIVALVGTVAGKMMVDWGMNIYVSIVVCLILGMLIGSWHGFWIAYVRIPSFIVTLAGMLLFRGISNLILNGQTVSNIPQGFTSLFNSSIDTKFYSGGKMIMSLTFIIAIVLCVLLVGFTVFTTVRHAKKKYAQESIVFTVVKLAVFCGIILFISYLLGNDKGLPVILILLAVIIVAYRYYTVHTVPGRRLYAMGGNEKAAKLSGIDTNKVLFFTYANMGFLAAIAALVCTARFAAVPTTLGNGFELDAIGACFIGGASAYGGVGRVGGAVIGAVFMGVLNNGMGILGVDANWQTVVKGAVLLAAVVFDVLSQKRKQGS